MPSCVRVDRLWSLTPWFYSWLFAAHGGFQPRLCLAAALATLWGTRLSYNFYRKGGYVLGQEDYRWAEIQRLLRSALPQSHRRVWAAFNLLFIASYQNVLLLLLATPLLAASQAGAAAPLNALDALSAVAFASMLLLEAAADEQQWAFQQTKRGRRKALTPALRQDCRRGFLTHGLFRFSRHPAFFAEQALWWAFYGFSVAAGAPLLNWCAAVPSPSDSILSPAESFSQHFMPPQS